MVISKSINWPSVVEAINSHRNRALLTDDSHYIKKNNYGAKKNSAKKNGVNKNGYWMPVISSDQAAVYYSENHSVFIKIFYETRLKHKIKNLFLPATSRHKRFIARTHDLHRLNIPAPDIIASGSIGKNGYVVTTAFSGMGLGSFFARYLSPEIKDKTMSLWRRSVVVSLGQLVADLHKAGIAHGDLRPNNILLDCFSVKPNFCFIDNERNTQPTKSNVILNEALVIKNLVQLNMIWIEDVSVLSRLRFIRSYFNGLNKTHHAIYASKARQKELIQQVQLKTEERLAGKPKDGYRKAMGFEPFIPNIKKLLSETKK
ncbi:MAG: lipopolysaccharide kinase InaA family protein [Cellvibrionaceae bacterium]